MEEQGAVDTYIACFHRGYLQNTSSRIKLLKIPRQ